ncbi:MAG: hypothetical protein AABY64_08565 [Bdellovibrionota bacterium]
MNNIIKITVTIALSVFILSCDRTKKDVSRLVFKMTPDAGSNSVETSAFKLSKLDTNLSTLSATNAFNSALDPSALADINCYAVFVGGPEDSMRGNMCKDSITGVEKMRFGAHAYAGFFLAGTEISLEVNSGPDRHIYLVGLKSQNGACVSFVSSGPDKANLSYPHIIGEVTMKLDPGTVTVPITTSLSATTQKFDSCDFPNGSGPSGTVKNLFGDARDGSLTIAPGTYDFQNTTFSSFSSNWVPTAGGISNSGKYLSSKRRITGLSTDRKTLTMASPSVLTAHFDAGDEVLWHVTAAAATTFPDLNGCGGGLYRGQWGTARVTAMSSPTVTLDSPVGDPSIALANSGSNLSQSTFTNPVSNPFCVVQLVRVPSFDTVTINSTATFKTHNSTNYFQYISDAGGGIFVMRAKKIVLGAGALNIDMIGAGFQGASGGSQGSGIFGLAGTASDTTSSENAGAGAAGGNGGGGGSNIGAGGRNDISAGSGGSPLTYCLDSAANNVACAPLFNQKFFLGGGGGGDNAVNGGAGGGAALVFAGEISGLGQLTIHSKGSAGGSVGGGGGGGGIVHLSSRSINNSAVSFDTRGGAGNAKGGGGGGGIIEVNYCGPQSTLLFPSLDSGSVAQGGAAGGTGNSGAGASGIVKITADYNACLAY